MNWMIRSLTPEEEGDVAAFMDRLARTAPEDQPRLGDAGRLFLRAQLLARWDRERAVHAPLDVMDRVQLVGGLVAAGLLLAWSLPSLARAIGFVTM